MAKLSGLLAVVTAMLVVMETIRVQGLSQKKELERKGQGRWRQRGYQNDKAGKGSSPRNKQRDHGTNGGPGRYRKPLHNFYVSYPDMSPPAFFNLRWNRELTRERPWWQGPNVCEGEAQEVYNSTQTRGDVMRHFSTNSQVCDESETVYKCKITQESVNGRREVTVVYECCHGYTREKRDFGCPKKVSMLALLDKAEELGLTDFVKAIKTLELTREFDSGNFTMFAPLNGAFTLDSGILNSEATDVILKDDPNVLTLSEPAVDKALRILRNALLSHVIPGTVKSSQMEDEQVLETGNSEDTTIRINYFSRPEKLMTANCVPVVSRDHIATNGVIHSVEKILKPVTDSLWDIVRSRSDLSTLSSILAAADYDAKLDHSGQLTLLAPTNSAFDKMNKRLREKLLSGDRECLEKVIQNHLLPNVICSVAIQGQAKTANELHRYINVTRTADNKLLVDEVRIVQADIVGTNGVMHVIEEVLVPDEAFSVIDLIKKEGYNEMLRLIDKAGLTKTLETEANITVFVPTNEAIQNLPVAVKTKLSEDSELLQEVINYHLSPEIQQCRRIQDDQQVPTLAGKNIRFNSYSMFPYHHHFVKTAQCAPIAQMNIDACNGRINVIKSVMMPPKGNVLDVLGLDKRFSTLVSLIKKSGLADDLQGHGPFTIIAPNNEAFEKMGQDAVDSIGKDRSRLQKLVKGHIVDGTLCCAGIFRRHWFGRSQVATVTGHHLRLSRDHDNRPKIGSAHVTRCDVTATNGNVLEVDRVLVQEQPRQRWREHNYHSWDMFEP
ncbi:unnamed protein product [Candidula unifasciata]|uniref:FAS1 domain-containing protein n=1 Tax=Candidula unifasciata TaxID=100452 RepID=A0A8S4ACN8_9EUPU|nr:unnamed protein product [Candidula unifasciata]